MNEGKPAKEVPSLKVCSPELTDTLEERQQFARIISHYLPGGATRSRPGGGAVPKKPKKKGKPQETIE